jgi:4-amino-4-deoxy-L-arabinose transferase-like glycosyltransferase
MKGPLYIFILLIIFGFLLYLPFIPGKEFQGEEGRRVLIALQMLETKEYLLPKLFGEPYFQKPPLFNLALAGFFKLTGDHSEFTARAFSALSMIVSALFLTSIWMKILNSLAERRKEFFILSLLPGLIFLTTPEVIDKALRAEIDAFYTLLITLSLFSWFYLHEIKNKKYLAFGISGFFLGLGILTKTFQALLFFYLAFLPYLFFQKRLREFFGLPHFFGILTIFSVFFFWAIPVSQKVGLKPFISAWLSEYLSSARAQEMGFLQHLESFTLQAILGFSPWIFTLLALRKEPLRNFFKEREPLNKLLLFSLFLFVFGYFFHFLFPGARLRYMLPSISGLVITATLVFYYYLQRDKLSQTLQTLLKLFLWLNIILLFAFIIYLLYKTFEVSPFFYLFVIFFLFLNLFFLLKKLNSSVSLFFYLVLYVFFAKQIYVSFYYPLHQKEMNYFRNSAFEIAELIKDKKELYLCQVIPHHLIYYLKYRYQLIEKVEYLKDCTNLPEKSYILLKDKNLLSEKNNIIKIYPLEIRGKNYFLIKTG